MAKFKNTKPNKQVKQNSHSEKKDNVRGFHFEFKNQSQKLAWSAYQNHDILFLIGPAGSAKSFLATAFAISEIKAGSKKKIVLTRPIVEAGEKLGFLPGDMQEKVDPYMIPLYDSIEKIAFGSLKEEVEKCLQIRPLAYMRGSTMDNAVCIFDEAQNATHKQLKLFLTRLGENSKMIVTGDPSQIDLYPGQSGLMDVISKVESINGIGVIEFKESSIVRHPIVAEIVKKLPD